MVLAIDQPVRAREQEGPSIRRLDEVLGRPTTTHPKLLGPTGEEIALPDSVYQLLRTIVHELASGAAVSVLPYAAMLSTQQAADFLNVSRPYLIRLLEIEHAIPFELVGTHRRVAFKELLDYRQREHQRRDAVLTKMVHDAESSGLYDAEAAREETEAGREAKPAPRR